MARHLRPPLPAGLPFSEHKHVAGSLGSLGEESEWGRHRRRGLSESLSSHKYTHTSRLTEELRPTLNLPGRDLSSLCVSHKNCSSALEQWPGGQQILSQARVKDEKAHFILTVSCASLHYSMLKLCQNGGRSAVMNYSAVSSPPETQAKIVSHVLMPILRRSACLAFPRAEV